MLAQRVRAAVVVMLVLGCAACGGATAPMPLTPESIVRQRSVPEAIVDAETGQEISLGDFYARLRRARVVYVGERHDRAEDHAAQYAILRELHKERGAVALGMEMFQRPFQDALDKWSAGQLDEASLRRLTEYDQRWGFDFALYRPMLEFARTWGLPLWALNAPRELTQRVAASGVEGLSPEERAQIPDLLLDDPAHRALFFSAFDGSDHGDPQTLDHYYEAQVVWDETMASGVAEALSGPMAPAQLLVIAGRVHIAAGLGIPSRAARRGAAPFLTVIPLSAAELSEELELPPAERAADFLWVVPE